MTWLAWRQFRTQALLTLGLLVAFAILVLVTGLHLRDVYESLGGAHCAREQNCAMLGTHERVLGHLLPLALIVVPVLLGMFWGAPLIARELESGTYRLAWTQSITRRRWLLTKAALVGLAALAVAGLASWLVSWWFAPLDHVEMSRFNPSVFSARGILAIGYAGFAFGLGVAAGGLTRRTVPAMAVTLFGFIAVRIPFTLWVREHLMPSKHMLVSLARGEGLGFTVEPSSGVTISASSPNIPNAWPLSSGLVNHAHRALDPAQLNRLLVKTCPSIAVGPQKLGVPGGSTKAALNPELEFNSCIQALSHHIQLLVVYQPASHYWPIQIIETTIFLLAGCALLYATIWRMSRGRARATTVGDPPRLAQARPVAEGTAERSVTVRS